MLQTTVHQRIELTEHDHDRPRARLAASRMGQVSGGPEVDPPLLVIGRGHRGPGGKSWRNPSMALSTSSPQLLRAGCYVRTGIRGLWPSALPTPRSPYDRRRRGVPRAG